MSVDLLFVAHNRLEFTKQAFYALEANTNWDLVRRLCVADDESEDGTAAWLAERCDEFDDSHLLSLPCEFSDRPLGGPVAAMNWYLALERQAEIFAKIDNDFIVCPGWLEALWRVMMDEPDLDVLGMQPSEEAPMASLPRTRGLLRARHIGGIGLIRRRIFDICRPTPNGRFGWSEWQTAHPEVEKAWLEPPLPAFCLDQLTTEPWVALTADYIERGWQRAWPFEPLASAYHDWWKPV